MHPLLPILLALSTLAPALVGAEAPSADEGPLAVLVQAVGAADARPPGHEVQVALEQVGRRGFLEACSPGELETLRSVVVAAATVVRSDPQAAAMWQRLGRMDRPQWTEIGALRMACIEAALVRIRTAGDVRERLAGIEALAAASQSPGASAPWRELRAREWNAVEAELVGLLDADCDPEVYRALCAVPADAREGQTDPKLYDNFLTALCRHHLAQETGAALAAVVRCERSLPAARELVLAASAASAASGGQLDDAVDAALQVFRHDVDLGQQLIASALAGDPVADPPRRLDDLLRTVPPRDADQAGRILGAAVDLLETMAKADPRAGRIRFDVLAGPVMRAQDYTGLLTPELAERVVALAASGDERVATAAWMLAVATLPSTQRTGFVRDHAGRWLHRGLSLSGSRGARQLPLVLVQALCLPDLDWSSEERRLMAQLLDHEALARAWPLRAVLAHELLRSAEDPAHPLAGLELEAGRLEAAIADGDRFLAFSHPIPNRADPPPSEPITEHHRQSLGVITAHPDWEGVPLLLAEVIALDDQAAGAALCALAELADHDLRRLAALPAVHQAYRDCLGRVEDLDPQAETRLAVAIIAAVAYDEAATARSLLPPLEAEAGWTPGLEALRRIAPQDPVLAAIAQEWRASDRPGRPLLGWILAQVTTGGDASPPPMAQLPALLADDRDADAVLRCLARLEPERRAAVEPGVATPFLGLTPSKELERAQTLLLLLARWRQQRSGVQP